MNVEETHWLSHLKLETPFSAPLYEEHLFSLHHPRLAKICFRKCLSHFPWKLLVLGLVIWKNLSCFFTS